MIIPGSGESNIDTYEENPYENPVQRRENTVQKLLDKLDPSMIVLDPTRLCTIREPPHAVVLYSLYIGT